MKFCFHYYVAKRILHSFPTRRSSDLSAWARYGDRHPLRRAIGEGRGGRRRWFLRRPRAFSSIAHLPSLCGHDNGRDRKSTRLNSSHLVMSYAVFCLKKKKTELL